MIREETRIALLEKEVILYREFAALMPTIAEVVKKYDGKCINKRFTDALQEALNGGKPERGKLKYNVTTGYAGEYFRIRTHAYDDSVKQLEGKYPDGENMYYHYRVSNNEHIFAFKTMECGEWTIGGKNWRMNANEALKVLDSAVIDLEEQAVNLEMEIAHATEAVEEMKEIYRKFNAFRGKYSYRFMEVMGLNCRLHNESGYEYNRSFYNV